MLSNVVASRGLGILALAGERSEVGLGMGGLDERGIQIVAEGEVGGQTLRKMVISVLLGGFSKIKSLSSHYEIFSRQF